MELAGEYFYGNRVSEEGRKYGRLDYGTLAKAFDAILNNDIMSKTWEIGNGWEQVSGWPETESIQEQIDRLEELNTQEQELDALKEQLEEAENGPEVFQWFIVSDQGAEILKECNEIVYYHEELDIYLWGVTHWGTSWDYVLTDVKINQGYKWDEEVKG